MDAMRLLTRTSRDDRFPEADDYDTEYLCAGLDPVLHPSWPTRVELLAGGEPECTPVPPRWWRRQLTRLRTWLQPRRRALAG